MENDYIKRVDVAITLKPEYLNPAQGWREIYAKGWNDAIDEYRRNIECAPAAEVVPIGEEYECGYTDGQMAERKALMRSADVVPVKHGRWKETLSTGGYPISICTVCNKVLPLTALYYRGFNYCPFCGAKVDGDK